MHVNIVQPQACVTTFFFMNEALRIANSVVSVLKWKITSDGEVELGFLSSTCFNVRPP